MIPGEVKTCAHCGGSGKCSCSGCQAKAGLEPFSPGSVACSACEGKGSVWIGPNIVQILEKTE